MLTDTDTDVDTDADTDMDTDTDDSDSEDDNDPIEDLAEDDWTTKETGWCHDHTVYTASDIWPNKYFAPGEYLVADSAYSISTFSLIYNLLIRALNDPQNTTGTDTVSNSIADIMKRLNLPEGTKVPKGRAVGSFLAARKGISIDDIVAQGHWASSSAFNDFYRISNSTKTNFTDIIF
ncbi:MAG: hypothetical protein BYD32DRAFT_460546 [Podila humilis]|nr:MAG: hypothetical protein BYD32DRAFT_460546 [Podila humilis]